MLKRFGAAVLATVLVIFLLSCGNTPKGLKTDIMSSAFVSSTGAGAAVGDTTAAMKAAHGTGYTKRGSQYEYTFGGTVLSFSVKDGRIAEIGYTLYMDKETRDLVAQMAKLCGNNIEEIRAFCQQIKYNNSYGGKDPVLYGFTNWAGNCFVHAMCYQALLQYKGYTSQIIHCADWTHYWNLVNTEKDGRRAWWHTDSTPGPLHGPTPTLATDAERYETLQNGYAYGTRDWERDRWPSNPY